jgi:hypothetical protein
MKVPTPPDQSVAAPASQDAAASRKLGFKRERDGDKPLTKRQKQALAKTAKGTADFVSGAPLFDPTIPLPKDKPAIATLLARVQKGTKFPKMMDSNGTSEYVCFHSAFSAHHNCCITTRCKNLYVQPPTTRLHIDPSIEPWKSKAESFWQPCVDFLRQLEIAKHFKPSPALIALTPSTTWT